MIEHHKGIGLVLSIIILFTGLLQNETAKANGQQNILICHMPQQGNTSNPQTIVVAEASLDTHLAHGDYAGSCGEELVASNVLFDVKQNRTYGVIGTLFELSAVPPVDSSPIIDYQWLLSDSRAFSGESIAVSFGEVGFFEATLTATSDSGELFTVTVGMVVQDPNFNAPDLLGLPDLLGDINMDGEITLLDAHLAAKFVGHLNSLSLDQQDALDMDFSGDATFDDARLIAGAVLNGGTFPDQLLSGSGTPGAIVTLVSPALQNPADFIEIAIGGTAQRQSPNRPIMGYVNFIIPFTSTLGPKDIQLFVNGSSVASYEFTVLEPVSMSLDPVAEVTELLDEVNSLLEINELLISQQLDAVLISDDTRTTLLAAAAAGRLQAAPLIAELQSLANAEGGGDLAAAFLLGANANGLQEYRARLKEFLAAFSGVISTASASDQQLDLFIAAAAISSDEICDNLLPAMCALKLSADLLDTSATIISTSCDIILAAGLAAVVFQGDFILLDTAFIGTWLSVCAPLEFTIDAAGLMTDLVSNIDANLGLSTSTNSPSESEPAIIKATLDVFAPTICQIVGAEGADRAVKVLSQHLVNRMIMRKTTIRAMTKVFAKFNEDILVEFLGLLESAAGKVITKTGVDDAILDFAQPYCEGLFGQELIINGSRVMSGPVPNEGTLTFQADGTAEYACPDPSGSSTPPPTVTITADKDICGVPQTKSVDLQCATRDVIITMGDNGTLNDDIYEVRLDGVTVLTSSSPVRSTSTTVELPVGSIHDIQMLGRAAPDGIGTYFISFSGAVVISGDATSGTDLVPGAVKNYTIEVLPQ